MARENARRLGLAERVALHHGDLLEPVAHLAGQVDLIACNPPYVDPSEVGSLAPEVRDHEPALALLPKGDRYELYRRLGPQAAKLLGRQRCLVLEIGQAMEAEVSRLGEQSGFVLERQVRDLQSFPRVLVWRSV